jgi:septal ring factor EnvC (AmiA/AmiB activator)
LFYFDNIDAGTIMASIRDQLLDAAPRNRQLLDILSQTDHAPSALEQQTRYVQDLNKQLEDVKKRIDQLGHERWKEGKDHKKYRDSVMKRWAYKVSGNKDKFASRAEKEEKEYFDV